jgi:hypothetical protein
VDASRLQGGWHTLRCCDSGVLDHHWPLRCRNCGGAEMYEHACRLGLEGIVSKHRDGRYRSGRSRGWLKVKNPDYERP